MEACGLKPLPPPAAGNYTEPNTGRLSSNDVEKSSVEMSGNDQMSLNTGENCSLHYLLGV